MARCTFLFILPRCTSLSKCTRHLLHECSLGNFWRATQVRTTQLEVEREPNHTTQHTTNSLPPPRPLPPPSSAVRRRRRKRCPSASRPTTATSTSMPRATCPCLTSRHWPGTYRTGRLTASVLGSSICHPMEISCTWNK